MLAGLRPHRAFLLLLLASLALSAGGLDWGLGSRKGWAADELLPQDVLRARAAGFSSGWHERYPPLHYQVLSLAYAPFLGGAVPDGEALPIERHAVLTRVGRIVSLAFWAGLLASVYACGLQLGTPRAALFAAGLVALSLPLVYYAKLANLEVPYLFWFALSLCFFLRALDGRAGLVPLALCAALAVTTKDQAFALYVLLPLPIMIRRWRDEPAGPLGPRLGRVLASRDVLAAALAFLAVLALAYRLPANLDGFRGHLEAMRSAARAFTQLPNDLSGHLTLLRATAANLAFGLGWPAFALCLLGLLAALRPGARHPRLLALLVPGLSYQLFFLAVALYCYDRFVLPWALVLSFFGARLLDELLAAGGARAALGGLALAAVLAFGLARAVSLDLQMQRDGRYAVEDWLAARVRPGEAVGQLAPSGFLPRLRPAGLRAVGPDLEELQGALPRFLVLNAAYSRRAEAGSAERAFLDQLERGRAGYRLALEHRTGAVFPALDTQRLERAGLVVSNLARVDPLIRVYERADAGP